MTDYLMLTLMGILLVQLATWVALIEVRAQLRQLAVSMKAKAERWSAGEGEPE